VRFKSAAHRVLPMGLGFKKGKKSSNCWFGAQGLNQGSNMRDSGLDIYMLYVLKRLFKREPFMNAADNGFTVGTMKI
jgi:ketol-acid reductoisomerase